MEGVGLTFYSIKYLLQPGGSQKTSVEWGIMALVSIALKGRIENGLDSSGVVF